MFTFLGRLTTNHPWKVLGVWLLLGALLTAVAPRWETAAQDDDIRFLPDRCDSVKGYRLLEQAFPREVYASRLLFAFEREDGPLTPADLSLVGQVVGDLNRLRESEPELKIARINSHQDPYVGARLVSKDKQCVLVQVSLGTPYLAMQTTTGVARAEEVVRERLSQSDGQTLKFYVTGPAGVGRDLLSAGADSLDKTTIATIILVVVILLFVYRSPLLALIPLVSIGISTVTALSLLSLCTLIPGFHLVSISRIFAVVMLYGAGTDYCLFLISRYREELIGGKLLSPAVQGSVGKVGSALAASAGTVVCGLGLMGLAEFAKVRCGGPAIALSLVVALIASLTLTPALLRLLGRAAFWPVGVPESARDSVERPDLWSRLSRVVAARPALIWTAAVAVLLPTAAIGFRVKANYRGTGELSPQSSSVLGLHAVQRHFTAGEVGPITILLASHTDWKGKDGQAVLSHMSEGMALLENVAEVRSLTQPLGEPMNRPAPQPEPDKGVLGGWLRKVKNSLASTVEEQAKSASRQIYIAELDKPVEGLDWLVEPKSEGSPLHVARLDVVLKTDPFDPASLPTLSVIQAWLKNELPRRSAHLNGLQAETYGITVNGRDLAEITESDRTRINVLVIVAVFLILLVLVRKLWLASYLLATVLLSYYATLGATTLMATWFTGRELYEVDWRVPFFLFTILVAVGEDYNILLITRALKERRRYGGVEGMRRALARTGGTITSCGLIMAGTFATLMMSGLNTLFQIGFALAFGVLLDTFVVRPFLVPAFAMMVWAKERPLQGRRLELPLEKRKKQRAA